VVVLSIFGSIFVYLGYLPPITIDLLAAIIGAVLAGRSEVGGGDESGRSRWRCAIGGAISASATAGIGGSAAIVRGEAHWDRVWPLIPTAMSVGAVLGFVVGGTIGAFFAWQGNRCAKRYQRIPHK
jgi:hypothetical protein